MEVRKKTHRKLQELLMRLAGMNAYDRVTPLLGDVFFFYAANVVRSNLDNSCSFFCRQRELTVFKPDQSRATPDPTLLCN